jgi:hypothetical protein
MPDIWDAVDVVSEVTDAAATGREAMGRSPMGFWRAMVAMVGGASWLMAGILPGIPAVMSVNRWMKGKSKRPTVAMACGVVTIALFVGAVVNLPFAAFGSVDEVGPVLAWARWITSGAAVLVVAWFLARHLFGSTSSPAKSAQATDPDGTAAESETPSI